MIERRLAWACGTVIALFVAGCGGDDGGGSGGSGAGSGGSGASGSGGNGDGGGGGGVVTAAGDCETSAECGGDPCVELTPGGFRVCQVDYPEATACSDPTVDECCDSSECASGACYEGPIVPFCTGVPLPTQNLCVADQCMDDAVCGADAICAPAGTLGRKVRACAPAYCKVNGDCADEAGGVCAPITEPCCGVPAGLYCVYPADGCRSNADCPSGYCEAGADGRARCATGAPACPP